MHLIPRALTLLAATYTLGANANPAKCLADICGPRSSIDLQNPSRPQTHLQRIDADYDLILKPLVQRTIENEIWENRMKIEILDFVSRADVSKAEISSDMRLILNFLKVFSFMGDLNDKEALVKDEDTGNYKLNRDRAISIARAARMPDVDSLIAAVDAVLAIKIFETIDFLAGKKISVIHKLVDKNSSYTDFLKEQFEYINLWTSTYSQINPLASQNKSPIMRKYLAGEAITDDDSEQFFNEYRKAYLIDQTVTNSSLKGALLGLKRDFVQEVRELKPKLAKSRQALIQELNADKLKVKSAEVSSLCSSQFRKLMRTIPLKNEIDAFHSQHLTRILESTARVLQREKMPELMESVRSIEWKSPVSYEATLQNWVSELESELQPNWDEDSFWQRLQAGDPSALGVAVANYVSTQTNELKDVLGTTRDLCKEKTPTGLTDSIYPKTRSHCSVGKRSFFRSLEHLS